MDIVITAALGYEHAAILPFMHSLRKVYQGRVACLINPEQLNEMNNFANQFSIDLVIAEGSKTGNPACDRFFIYKNYLDSNKDLTRVFLTDSRDVIFQASPFVNELPHLYLFSEPKNIQDCQINSSWVRLVYGDDALNKLNNFPILCSGTTLGSYDMIRNYLENMCEEMSLLKKSNEPLVWGTDQTVHMYLYYSGKLPLATIRKHGLSEVQTLHHETNFIFDKECFLLNLDLKKVHVIHQYDRHQQFFPIFSQMLSRQ